MLARDMRPPRAVAPSAFDFDDFAAAVRLGRPLGGLPRLVRLIVEAEHGARLVFGHLAEDAPASKELMRDVPLAPADAGVVDARLDPIGLRRPLGILGGRLGRAVQPLGGGVDALGQRLGVALSGALLGKQPGALVVELAERLRVHAPRPGHLAHELRPAGDERERHVPVVLLDQAPQLVDEAPRAAVRAPHVVGHGELGEFRIVERVGFRVAQEHQSGEVGKLVLRESLRDAVPLAIEPLHPVRERNLAPDAGAYELVNRGELLRPCARWPEHSERNIQIGLVKLLLDFDVLRLDGVRALDLRRNPLGEPAHAVLVLDDRIGGAAKVRPRPLRSGIVERILVRLRRVLAALKQRLLDSDIGIVEDDVVVSLIVACFQYPDRIPHFFRHTPAAFECDMHRGIGVPLAEPFVSLQRPDDGFLLGIEHAVGERLLGIRNFRPHLRQKHVGRKRLRLVARGRVLVLDAADAGGK